MPLREGLRDPRFVSFPQKTGAEAQRGVSSAALGSLRGHFSSLSSVFLRKSPVESLTPSGWGGSVCRRTGEQTLGVGVLASWTGTCFSIAVDKLIALLCHQLNWSQAQGTQAGSPGLAWSPSVPLFSQNTRLSLGWASDSGQDGFGGDGSNGLPLLTLRLARA